MIGIGEPLEVHVFEAGLHGLARLIGAQHIMAAVHNLDGHSRIAQALQRGLENVRAPPAKEPRVVRTRSDERDPQSHTQEQKW